MSIFKNLFAQSPFSPLQSHMEKVADCAAKTNDVFEAYAAKDFKKIGEIEESDNFLF